MQKVYECLTLDVAKRVERNLNEAGIDAYLIDYSRRVPGASIGFSVSENPTVYISDSAQYEEAKKVIVALERELFGKDFASKPRETRRENKDSKPYLFHKLLIVIAVVLMIFIMAIMFK